MAGIDNHTRDFKPQGAGERVAPIAGVAGSLSGLHHGRRIGSVRRRVLRKRDRGWNGSGGSGGGFRQGWRRGERWRRRTRRRFRYGRDRGRRCGPDFDHESVRVHELRCGELRIRLQIHDDARHSRLRFRHAYALDLPAAHVGGKHTFAVDGGLRMMDVEENPIRIMQPVGAVLEGAGNLDRHTRGIGQSPVTDGGDAKLL